MRDRKRRRLKTKNGVFRSGFFDQKKKAILGPILCEIKNNADRKRKTAFFDLDFSIRKKNYLRPDLMRDRKRRSKTKNGVFRSGFFDQKKKAILDPILCEIENEKRRFPIWIFRSEKKAILGPILSEIENADRKRKTAFFDLEFFDQKNKAILCARILAISVQHFSI